MAKPAESYAPAPGGGRIWTAVQGSGPPVLLMSGGPGCCDYLRPVADLIDGACTAIRFDFRGCGRSSGADEYSVASQLADIEAVRAHYGIERWVVAGHSWGGDLAVIYALEHPERTRAIAPMAGGRMNNDRDWSAAYQRGRDAGLEPDWPFDYPPNMTVNQQVNASAKAYIKQPDLFRRIADSPVPARFTYGALDIRPSWAVEQVARLMPNGEFFLLVGANHYLWSTHADALGPLLHSLLWHLDD